MKNRIKIYIVSLFLLMGIIFSGVSIAQPPPPSDHGEDLNQPGGAAPLGGGLLILVGLGAVYGGKKLRDAWKKIDE